MAIPNNVDVNGLETWLEGLGTLRDKLLQQGLKSKEELLWLTQTDIDALCAEYNIPLFEKKRLEMKLLALQALNKGQSPSPNGSFAGAHKNANSKNEHTSPKHRHASTTQHHHHRNDSALSTLSTTKGGDADVEHYSITTPGGGGGGGGGLRTRQPTVVRIVFSEQEEGKLQEMDNKLMAINEKTDQIMQNMSALNWEKDRLDRFIDQRFDEFVLELQRRRAEVKSDLRDISAKQMKTMKGHISALNNQTQSIHDAQKKCEKYVSNTKLTKSSRKSKVLKVADKALADNTDEKIVVPEINLQSKKKKHRKEDELKTNFVTLELDEAQSKRFISSIGQVRRVLVPYPPKFEIFNIEASRIKLKVWDQSASNSAFDFTKKEKVEFIAMVAEQVSRGRPELDALDEVPAEQGQQAALQLNNGGKVGEVSGGNSPEHDHIQNILIDDDEKKDGIEDDEEEDPDMDDIEEEDVASNVPDIHNDNAAAAAEADANADGGHNIAVVDVTEEHKDNAASPSQNSVLRNMAARKSSEVSSKRHRKSSSDQHHAYHHSSGDKKRIKKRHGKPKVDWNAYPVYTPHDQNERKVMSGNKYTIWIDNLRPNTQYLLRLRGCNKYGKGDWTKIYSFVTKLTAFEFNSAVIKDSETKNRVFQILWKKLSLESSSLSSMQTGEKSQTFALKRLFSTETQGFVASKFHEACDGRQRTLVIAESEYGNIFGGYTSLNWSSPDKDKWKTDQNAFLFLLRNERKQFVHLVFDCTDPYNATRSNLNSGPCFGAGFDLYIADNANKSDSSYSTPKSYNIPQNLFIGGRKNFRVKNYDVYAVV